MCRNDVIAEVMRLKGRCRRTENFLKLVFPFTQYLSSEISLLIIHGITSPLEGLAFRTGPGYISDK